MPPPASTVMVGTFAAASRTLCAAVRLPSAVLDSAAAVPGLAVIGRTEECDHAAFCWPVTSQACCSWWGLLWARQWCSWPSSLLPTRRSAASWPSPAARRAS
jgi:hypothetical protein